MEAQAVLLRILSPDLGELLIFMALINAWFLWPGEDLTPKMKMFCGVSIPLMFGAVVANCWLGG